MIGDNLEWDIAVPQTLGIRAIWVRSNNQGLPQHAAAPDLIIGSLAELLD